MLSSDTKLFVINSISELELEMADLEQLVFERVSKKMDEKNQALYFDEKILLTAFCAFVRELFSSKGNNEPNLDIYAQQYRAYEHKKSLYIRTGIFLMSVLRDLMPARCDENIINAWGEVFLHVYTRLSGRMCSQK